MVTLQKLTKTLRSQVLCKAEKVCFPGSSKKSEIKTIQIEHKQNQPFSFTVPLDRYYSTHPRILFTNFSFLLALLLGFLLTIPQSDETLLWSSLDLHDIVLIKLIKKKNQNHANRYKHGVLTSAFPQKLKVQDWFRRYACIFT